MTKRYDVTVIFQPMLAAMRTRRHAGVTLIEALVAIAVVAVILALGLPLFISQMEARRVSAAAEQVRSFLAYGRSEAIRQNKLIVTTYSMTGAPGWRLGMRDDITCHTDVSDPEDADACSLPVVDGRSLSILDGGEFIAISGSVDRAATHFRPVQGTAGGTNATVTLISPGGKEARVVVSPIGRIRTCSPDGAGYVTGLPAC